MAAPLRLALIAHRIQHNDGQGRVNYELARAALAQGLHVTLLAAHCADDLAAHANATFIRLGRESWPTQFLRNLAFAQDTTAWLRAHRGAVDVVQANGFVTWEPCDLVAMHFVHSSWLKSAFYPFKSWKPYDLYQRSFTVLNSRWEKRAVRSARLVVAVSDAMATQVGELGVAPERIATVPNGVDIQEFHPGPPERGLFGLPEGVPMLLFVGDIRSPRKNLFTLLKALQRLPDVHLAVAGEVKGSAAPAQAHELGIADRVHFLGKTAQIPALMRSVNAFVFPSLYEPYGLVVAEAMASGLPVIASRHVGAVGTFRGALEVMEDAQDAQALAAVLSALLQAPERRRDIGVTARARAIETSWQKTTAAYLRLIEQLAEERRAQDS